MKQIHRITTFLLIAVMILSAFQITAVAAIPSRQQAISITADPAGPYQMTVGETKQIKLTSTYSSLLKWRVSTTLGTASIASDSDPSTLNDAILTIKSGIAGTGKVVITATDSRYIWIRSSISINFEVVPISDTANNAPVFPGNYTIVTDEDTSGNVVVTATDADNDAPTYTHTQPSNGAVSKAGTTYYFTPNQNFNGADSFTVTASDGKASTTVNVAITVNPVNDAPVAANDTAKGKVGETVRVYVLANDSDVDTSSNALSIFSYTPVEGAQISKGYDYFDITAENTGAYTFSYSAYDGIAVSNLAYVTVTFTDDLVYVALGDSIPAGYYNTSLWNYITGGTNSYSYIEQFRDAMGILPANYYDESVGGNNSIDVLNQLSNSVIASEIAEADVITLCIGGNDIMDAVTRTYSGLSKYNVNWTVADQGRDNFEANWCRIIDGIEEINPDVTLIVMTVYNPYRLTDSYYAIANPYFEDTSSGNYGINYIIRNTQTLYADMLSDAFDYRVVDIYKAFNASANKDSLTGFYSSFCDPHPNQTGHNLIFAEHYKIFSQCTFSRYLCANSTLFEDKEPVAHAYVIPLKSSSRFKSASANSDIYMLIHHIRSLTLCVA